jgi:hypothetical protein
MSKPLPPEPPYPWYLRWRNTVIAYATWPWAVHQMKREGWRRIGWMQWESPGAQHPWDRGYDED